MILADLPNPTIHQDWKVWAGMLVAALQNDASLSPEMASGLYQPLDAGLTWLSSLTFNSEATFKSAVNLEAGVDFNAFDAGLEYLSNLNFTNEATFKAAVNLEAGIDFNAYDAGLEYLSGLNFTNEATFKAGVNLEIGVDVQGFDADLSAIAALASTGFSVRTASNTWTQRSITTSGAGVTITNGDGVSGNPTISMNQDLAALEALSGTGVPKRTSGETWALFTVTAAGEALLDDADASAQRTTLGLGTGDSPTFTGLNVGTVTGSANVRFSNNVFLYGYNGGTSGEVRAGFYLDGTNGITYIYSLNSLTAFFGNGLVLGNPTGGDKGLGKLNVAGDVYKNNTAYTNPDYIFEHYYMGRIKKFIKNPGAAEYSGLMDLGALREFTKRNHHLPQVPHEGGIGIFERGDYALRAIEELTLYILQLHERLEMLENV